MKSKYFKKNKLPDKPGVYFFKKGSDVLYIGKATSLRDRVKSYFSRDLVETRGPIILDMVFKADKIEWQETNSVLEAIILEANLIKKYQPKYNTKEKDDKSFNYVCISKEFLPRVIVVRGKNVKHSVFNKIYGPYTSGPQLREALKIIRRIFPFLDDKSKNYLEFYQQINLVPDLNDKKLYLQNIKNIKLFFEGKKKKILQNLKKEMNNYSKLREFEKAGEMKRQIFALQHVNDVALIKESFADNKIFDPAPFFGRREGNKAGPSDAKISSSASLFRIRIESYDVAHMGGKNMIGVMVVLENGELEKSEYKKFKIRTQDNAPARNATHVVAGGNDTGALAEILERRFAHKEWQYPDLIVVDGGVAQINVAKKIISRVVLDIPVVSVVKNEQHKPKAILGNDPRHGGASKIITKYKREILLANSEAHRFATAYHKKVRARNFLR